MADGEGASELSIDQTALVAIFPTPYPTRHPCESGGPATTRRDARFRGHDEKGDRELQPVRGEWHLQLAEEGFRHVGMDLRAWRKSMASEFLQMGGAYKFRGIFNRVRLLDEDELRRGIVTISSGNAGSGTASPSSPCTSRS